MGAIYRLNPGRKEGRKKIFIAVLGMFLFMLNITGINPSALAAELGSQETAGDNDAQRNGAMMYGFDIQGDGAATEHSDSSSAADGGAEEIIMQPDSSPDGQEMIESAETISGNDETLPMEGKEGETEVQPIEQPDGQGKTEIQLDVQSAEEEGTTIGQPDGQEAADIIWPDRIEVAFNPLGLAVNMGDGSYSTNQVISRSYEILNKGSTDQIVEIVITVEDLNGGQLLFVDSPETVKAAEERSYAVYLAVVLSTDVPEAEQEAIPLHSGENKIAFRLSGGAQRTFAFGGAMNERADWSKLSEGVRFSVAYTYENAEEDEMDTDAAETMMEVEEENTDLNTAEAVHGL